MVGDIFRLREVHNYGHGNVPPLSNPYRLAVSVAGSRTSRASKGVPVMSLKILGLIALIHVIALVSTACQSPPPPTPDIPATVAAQVRVEMASQVMPTPAPTWATLPPVVVQATSPPSTPTPRPTLTPALTLTRSQQTSPPSTPTPRPTLTPTPTLTRSQQLMASLLTPEPKDVIFAKYPPERIITVGKCRESKIWRDKEPFLLLGCKADVDAGRGKHYFSDRGSFNKEVFLVSVGGTLADNRTGSNCYAMQVRYIRTEGHCFYTSFVDIPLLPWGKCPDSGWTQQTPEVMMAATTHSWSTSMNNQEMSEFR